LEEYRKNILGSAIQTITVAVISGIIGFFCQPWFNSNLEYKATSRNAYLSALLGQQGLNMAFKGKPLKNVSVVEFSIFNRTSKQVNNADLTFSIDEKASVLVLSDVTPPRGMSKKEFVEPIPPKDPKDQSVRKFRLKTVPSLQDRDSFHAVFVFEGEKAPSVSLHGSSGEISVVPYQEWKNTIMGVIFLLTVYTLFLILWITLCSLIKYFILEPRIYKERIRAFVDHAKQLQHDGQPNLDNPQVIEDARKIYASFIKPKSSKFWSKMFPAQQLEDEP
jgi:hypothetical protein